MRNLKLILVCSFIQTAFASQQFLEQSICHLQNSLSITGTAVIISQDGAALTNNHVIQSATGEVARWATVECGGGKRFQARRIEYLGSLKTIDLSVIRLDLKQPLSHWIPLYKGKLRIGQLVTVQGYPTDSTGGFMRLAKTSGKIEALSAKTLRTSAGIAPGSSGSPILNTSGELVGIVNAGGREKGALYGKSFGFNNGTIAYALKARQKSSFIALKNAPPLKHEQEFWSEEKELENRPIVEQTWSPKEILNSMTTEKWISAILSASIFLLLIWFILKKLLFWTQTETSRRILKHKIKYQAEYSGYHRKGSRLEYVTSEQLNTPIGQQGKQNFDSLLMEKIKKVQELRLKINHGIEGRTKKEDFDRLDSKIHQKWYQVCALLFIALEALTMGSLLHFNLRLGMQSWKALTISCVISSIFALAVYVVKSIQHRLFRWIWLVWASILIPSLCLFSWKVVVARTEGLENLLADPVFSSSTILLAVMAALLLEWWPGSPHDQHELADLLDDRKKLKKFELEIEQLSQVSDGPKKKDVLIEGAQSWWSRLTNRKQDIDKYISDIEDRSKKDPPDKNPSPHNENVVQLDRKKEKSQHTHWH